MAMSTAVAAAAAVAVVDAFMCADDGSASLWFE